MSIRYLSGINVDSNVLFVDSANNRVGVGTGSPADKLHVNAGSVGGIRIQADTEPALYLNTTDGTSNVNVFNSYGNFGIEGLKTTSNYIMYHYGGGGTAANQYTYFQTAGVERMRITGAGNVGIGTTAPNTPLEVRGSSGEVVRLSMPNTYTAGEGPKLSFWNATSEELGFVRGVFNETGQGNRGNLLFGTRTSDALGAETKMTILHNGNVGIGTTSPDKKLVVTGFGTGTAKIGDAGFGSGNYTGISLNGTLSTGDYNILSSPTDKTLYINRPSGVGIQFREDNQVQMLIQSGGNVGIGTTSPASLLHISGSGNTFTRYTNTTSAGHYIDIGANSAGQSFVYGYGAYPLLFATNGSERMRITDAGNVGIGTTSPATKLQVNGTFASNALWTDAGSVSYWGNYSTAYGGLTWDTGYATVFATSGNSLRFGSNGASPDMVIDTSGNVGVGTTDPSGGGVVGSKFTISVGDNETAFAILSGSSRRLAINTLANGGFVFYDGGSGIWNAGIAQVNGSVGIGTTSPAYKLDVNGTFHTAGDATFNGTNVYINSSYIYVGNNTADLVSISGNTMYFPGNGTVGIGTTSPGAKLEIISANLSTTAGNESVQSISSVNNGNGSYLEVKDVRTDNGSDWTSAGKRIQERIDSTYMGYIQFNGSSNNGGISFGTGYTTAAPGNVSERMRITDGGNVGIGTTSPVSKLHVQGSGPVLVAQSIDDAVPARIVNLSNGISTIGFQANGSANSYNVRVGCDVSDFIAYTSNSERLRITGSGNVGIGTTAPLEKLHVAGNEILGDVGGSTIGYNSTIHTGAGNQTSGTIRAFYGFTNPAGWYVNVGDAWAWKMAMVARPGVGGNYNSQLEILRTTRDGVTDATTMAFSREGNVGIGTTAPSEKLVVYGAIRSTYQSNDFGAGGVSAIMDMIGASKIVRIGSVAGGDTLTGSQGSIYFLVRGNPIASFDASGNLGINTTSPSYKLHVEGTAYASDYHIQNSAGTGGIFRIDGYQDYLYFYGDTSSAIAGYRFGSDLVGVVMQIGTNGNVGIGTTSPNYPLHVKGGSVKFESQSNLTGFFKANTTQCNISFEDTTNGSNDIVYIGSIGNNFIIATTYNERVRVNGSGNLGIATTNPTAKLHVNGTVRLDNSGNAFTNAYTPAGGNTVSDVVGNNNDSRVLGTPDIWLRVNIGGTNYVFPGYTEP